MSTAIGSYADFVNWNGSGNVYLTTSITITNTSYSSTTMPYTLNSGQTFDGKGYTITVDNGGANFNGLFKLNGGTIHHLNLQITTGALSSGSGWLVYGSNTSSITGAYGIVYNTFVTNSGGSMETNCGGLVGVRAAVPSDGTIYVTGTSANNLNIVDCGYHGLFPNGGGGILGKFASNIKSANDGTYGGGVITIKKCFVNITGSGSNGGGIVGSFMGKNYSGANNIIQQCIVTGSATGNFTGGFVGSDGYCDITDSYSLYNIDGRSASGGFYYQKSHGTITTSYYLGGSSFGSNSNSFISETSVGTSVLTITNCATSGSTFGNSADISLTGTNLTSYTTSTINTTSPLSSFDNVIWNTAPNPPILAAFTNTSKWNNYSAYNNNPSIVFSSDTYVIGDPHICAMNGDSYDLNVIGSFLLFDNNFMFNRLIINGQINNGDGIFSKLKYVRKLYINANGKKLLIDMGFRGKPILVLHNDGFLLTETVLQLTEKSYTYCNDCNFRIVKSINKVHDRKGHSIMPKIRNKVEINIHITNDNLYKITLMNVDENNSHPCQISIDPLIINDEKIKKYSGAYVRNENLENITLNMLTEHKQMS